jgi:CDP-paratose 2-epimerase
MKYLITGGCGFLGSNIAERLLKDGHELCIYDNLSRQGSEKNYEWLKSVGNFSFFKFDIQSFENIDNVIKNFKPDVIFHLAGQVAMTTSIQNPRLDFETNILGSFNVLESVKTNCRLCSIIYSSTNKVYGDLEWVSYEENDTRYKASGFENGFPENIQLEFHSPYGVSKGSADQYMLDYSRIFGLKTAVFRHSSMYGGRQFSTADQGWIGWFCEQAILQKENPDNLFTISGNGKQVRDLLYSEDMVNLYLSAANNMNKISGQAFNIGGGIENSYSLIELLDFLGKELQINLKYTKINKRESDQKVFVADYSKINNLINWQPKISKEVGVRKMIEWIKQIK